MVDIAGEEIACQYCGSDIQVPADRSRFQAAVAHFETEHVGRPEAAPETSFPTTYADTDPTEEPELSD